MLGMQVAALMSGKKRVGLADLHYVCAHWLQATDAAPPGLEAFGSQDVPAAHSHLAHALRYHISCHSPVRLTLQSSLAFVCMQGRIVIQPV